MNAFLGTLIGLRRRELAVELAGKLHRDVAFGVSVSGNGVVEHFLRGHLARALDDVHVALQQKIVCA